MSTPKVIRAAQTFFQQMNHTVHKLTKQLVSWLLRNLLLIGRQPSKAGFVLPTTILLLLVVVLTVGAIGYRTFTRTQQAITERQQQVIYNAATPVIDRAKSKIEFLFDPRKDTRGGGVPREKQLLSMMLNNGVDAPYFVAGDPSVDPYTLDGETRLDINSDGKPDNAWRYRVDLDGDGNVNSPGNKDGWAVYSIIFKTPVNSSDLKDSRNDPNAPNVGWQKRAKSLEVRNAPLSNGNTSDIKCQRDDGTASSGGVQLINGEGWFPDQRNTTKIRKNFQVTAYVIPDNTSGSVATLEFQQDREATQGFKWAAWFRNDLEIFPGPVFNWNGAMHTEGNLIVGGDKFRGFLVSSPSSCIKSSDASEITTRLTAPTFKGRVITGTLRDNTFAGTPTYDLPPVESVKQAQAMGTTADSVTPGNLKPTDFALDPVAIQTQNISIARNPAVNSATNEDPNWLKSDFASNGQGRFRSIDDVTTPYVDDTFRADNRWGPKPTWGRDALPIGILTKDSLNSGATSTVKIGDPITGAPELTGSDPAAGVDTSSVGLDGYWERRARVEGLRLIVGQRLELGDPAGWGGPGGASGSDGIISLLNEPLRPWSGCTASDPKRCNEERQRKALWDNLAAVQATAVYHNAKDTTPQERDFPDACLVTTVHPGTPTTLDRSATFENLAYGLPSGAIPGYTDKGNPLIITDFFRGRGTNGWEFSPPPASAFNKGSDLMTALRNLAYYAGDPNGGAPSFRPQQQPVGTLSGQVRPYPSMGMWGDFSMLRKVFELIDSNKDLSPADLTTLHTAGCMLGMLAYNLDYLEQLKVYDPDPTKDPTKVGTLTDGSMRSLSGYTNAELANLALTGKLSGVTATATNLTVDANLLKTREYSSGLRGRIRVIDHISKGAITSSTSATKTVLNIPADLRPPDAFINSLVDIDKESSMELLAWDNSQSNNPEAYVRLLERWRDALARTGTDATQRDQLNKEISLAQLIITKEQVARDRTWGFSGMYGSNAYNAPTPELVVSTAPLGDCGSSNPAAPPPNTVPGWLTDPDFTFTLKDPTDAKGVKTLPPLKAKPDPYARFCSFRPRYPILYSLFPAKMANAFAAPATTDAGYSGGFLNHKDISDTTERRVTRDFEDSTSTQVATYIIRENAKANYAVVKPANIALKPSRLSQAGVTLGDASRNWVLPYTAASSATGTTPNNSNFNLLKICTTRCSDPNNVSSTFQLPVAGNLVRVAFKDSAFYNGRELMPVRALNLDLRLMADSPYNGDLWLPQKGIVYAYREDAVSEGHIVRPNSSAWNDCNTNTKLQTTTCAMQTADRDAYASTDPPLNDSNYISPKPVDYYPDPDRRPYGFRLLQGSSLKRNGDEGRGLSLISDNPVYVQGNFNLHQKGGTELQEFTDLLTYDANGLYNNFYNRQNLNLDFAKSDQDEWRPSEIVADAVTLLSDSFCDGSIEDGLSNPTQSNLPAWIPNTRYGCSSTRTSFYNQNRLTDVPSAVKNATWVRTNLIDNFPRAIGTVNKSSHNIDEGESPIYITRNGEPTYWKDVSGNSGFYAGNYVAMQNNKSLIDATNDTRMNLILVSGLVPSREGQSYGGLHNFPRFLENWGNDNLYISGALLQLNFSNYANAPFDQENWQIGSDPPKTGDNTNEWIRYYSPPNRRWGYDVGLQYARPGEVAKRFQFAEDTRSEFYTEPPANDPYIRNLCLQVPGKTDATCPK
jgi:hypothetical protein